MNATNKTIKIPLKTILWLLLLTFLQASAFVIFSTYVRQLETPVAFTWFMGWAALTSFVVAFYHERKRPNQNGVVGIKKWHSVIGVGKSLARIAASEHQNILFLTFILFITSLAYVLSWFPLLSTLQSELAVPILIVIALTPVLNVFFSKWILGDKVESWNWFKIGAILSIIGVVMFQIFGSDPSLMLSLTPLLLVILNMFLSIVYNVCKIYLVRRDLHSSQVVAISNLSAFTIGIVIILLQAQNTTNLRLFPSLAEHVALFYLGVIPTGIVLIFSTNMSRDYGVPIVETIGSAKPLFSYVITLIIFTCLNFTLDLNIASQEIAMPTFFQWAGILLLILGISISYWLGKPRTNKTK